MIPSEVHTAEIEHDEAWRFAPQERRMMRDAGYRFAFDPKAFVTAQPANFAGGSFDWQHEEAIAHRLDDKNPETIDRDTAIAYLQERFGCAYRTLSDEQKADPELLMLATVQSSGHALRDAPEKGIQDLKADWWIEAISRGARGWILQYAPDSMRNNDDVVMACVSNCGDSIRYASDRLRADPEVQKAAVSEYTKAIDYCIDPTANIVDLVKRAKVPSTNGHGKKTEFSS